jgi:MtN3 and saliva related transmembrane protein
VALFFDKKMLQIEILGLVAGMFVALGLVPQIVRVWRLKSAQEISLSFNLLFLIGTMLWLAYGLFLGLISVIVWNGANSALLMLLLTVKLKFGMDQNTPTN